MGGKTKRVNSHEKEERKDRVIDESLPREIGFVVQIHKGQGFSVRLGSLKWL